MMTANKMPYCQHIHKKPGMDIELLRTFLEVKTTRHFGKAAENLYLTQAAVSARIKQLESVIGSPVFTRYRNNLQLTPTGERLISHAETILLAWERARQEVSLKKKQARLLALGATSGLWDLMLQDTLLEVHALHPELALRAEVHGPETLIRQLMERTLDLALVYEPAKLNELESVAVSQAELVLISSQKSASPEQAFARSFVAIDWGQAFQINFTQLYPETPPAALHTSQSRLAMDFISRFGGSAYLPYRMVEKSLGKSFHIVEGAPLISRPIYACYHKDNTLQKELDMIIETIGKLDVAIQTATQAIEL
ncbi:MAG: LysR family transcriptional regulator [Oleiphilus sp.]|nr:MAG: LysR family transcriptional regulator [Oleiphilus sp.]